MKIESRFIGKCGCGERTSALLTERYAPDAYGPAFAPVFHTSNGFDCVLCRACNHPVIAKRVLGRRNGHACDAKCLASKGHSCECACGGKNHGASWER